MINNTFISKFKNKPDGILSRKEILDSNFTDYHIRSLVKDGTLKRVSRGQYKLIQKLNSIDFFEIGKALEESNMFVDAIDLYEKSLFISQKKDLVTYYHIVGCYICLYKYQEAADYLVKMYNIDKDKYYKQQYYVLFNLLNELVDINGVNLNEVEHFVKFNNSLKDKSISRYKANEYMMMVNERIKIKDYSGAKYYINQCYRQIPKKHYFEALVKKLVFVCYNKNNDSLKSLTFNGVHKFEQVSRETYKKMNDAIENESYNEALLLLKKVRNIDDQINLKFKMRNYLIEKLLTEVTNLKQKNYSTYKKYNINKQLFDDQNFVLERYIQNNDYENAYTLLKKYDSNEFKLYFLLLTKIHDLNLKLGVIKEEYKYLNEDLLLLIRNNDVYHINEYLILSDKNPIEIILTKLEIAKLFYYQGKIKAGDSIYYSANINIFKSTKYYGHLNKEYNQVRLIREKNNETN